MQQHVCRQGILSAKLAIGNLDSGNRGDRHAFSSNTRQAKLLKFMQSQV
jgi:hypothetical protein